MISVSLTERAYSELKQRVIRCELAPGAYYTEAGLAAQLDLGKTPTREALARLAQEGWVRSAKGRGYEVLPLSIGGIREVFGARLVLEPATVEQAAGKLEPCAIDRLLQLCDVRYLLDDGQSCIDYLAANREIHLTIVDACGNQLLAQMTRQLLERCERLMHLGLLVHNWNEDGANQHRGIVNALRDKMGQRARELCAEHIRAGEQAAIEALLSTPAMQDAPVRLTTAAR